MSSKGKGKEIAGKDSYGKRKRDASGGNDKSGGRKRRNPNVVQFVDDVAADFDGEDDESSDDSLFGDDFFVDEFQTELKVKSEPGKAHHLPFLPKEEEMGEEELEMFFEERYKSGSGFVTYAEDKYETKRSVQRDIIMPSAKEPTIWKVKCVVGREKHSAFCLMQKFVDLNSLGTKLQIISAFAVEHIKGFIYMEADKQNDVIEACKGLCSIYSSRVALVPINEISHLLSVRSKSNEVSVGMWARVKSGKYKGDLAQVVALNDARKKATVKLLPRIDLQVLTEKFGGGVTAKKTTIPQGGGVTAKKTTTAPRLISSYELEEFRPLIQYRRDRDTDKFYEVLDGMMLKDGYLYKKVSIDSLSFWGVMPSEDELQRFKSSEKDESNNVEWLSQLYGVENKKLNLKTGKGGGIGGKGGKGEGSSGSSMGNSFEVHDLVCFGRKDFGVIISMEKADYYKILKDSPEGPVPVTLESNQLKTALFDKKFTALDKHKKSISISDTVKILEGPLEGRQGIVKQIYRGTIFLYDENEEQNGGYFCSRSQMCEKVKLFNDSFNEKGGKSGSSGFEDFMSSPKSPLSPKKPWQARENSDFNRGDKEGMFSVGQSLRIRVGPLKGYLCRVLAIRRSDVTVKLDSKQKVLTVKYEHLSEVRGKSSAFSLSEDPDSISIKPFDMLGNQGCSTDWMDGAGAGASAEGDGWNAGGASAERSSWPAFPASRISLQSEHNSANAFGSVDNDSKKDCEVTDAAWDSRVTSNQNSSWGTATDGKMPATTEQAGGWGNHVDCSNNATTKGGFGSIASGGWDKAELSSGDQAGSSKMTGDNWGKGKFTDVGSADASGSWAKNKSPNEEGSWGKGKNVAGNSTSTGGDNWNNVGSGWNQQKSGEKICDDVGGDGSTWGKAVESQGVGNDKRIQEDSWGKGSEKQSSINDSEGSRDVWKSSSAAPENPTRGWGNSGGSWSQKEAGNTDEASGWKKAKSNDGQSENWGNKRNIGDDSTGLGKSGSGSQDQRDKWDNPKPFSAAGGSSWDKQDGGSWNKPVGGSSWNKDGSDQQESWEKPKSFDEGSGSGGRRGRGRGERDHLGRGRSFARGQSSDWNKQGQDNYQAGDGTSMGHSSGWNNEQTGGWSKTKAFDGGKGDHDWNKPNASGEDNVSNQNKGWGGAKEMGAVGDKWNSSKAIDGSKSSWTSEGSDRDRGGTGSQSSGWHTGGSNWKDGNLSSGGNKGPGDHGGGWNESKAPGESQKTNWNSGASVVVGSQSSGWGNNSNSDQGTGWKNGTSADGKGSSSTNEQSGWDTKKDWNTSQGMPSSWNQKSADNEKDVKNKDHTDGWNTGKISEGGSAAGWGQSSGWKSGNGDAGGGRGGGGGSGNCYKCGESGHFSRECPSAGGGGGGGGGGNCYKCGESGHFSRECPSASGGGGGGGGGSQFSGWGNNNNSDQGTGWKSGTSADGKGSSSTNEQSGWDTKKGWNTSQGMPSSWNQKSADNEKDVKNKDHTDGWNTGKTSEGDSAAGWGQSSGWKSGNGDAGGGRGGGGHGGGGGGGGNCYKCGESGHFSRECPSGGGRGGGGGGGNCYKCGESGHFARECPSAGGGGGGGGSGNCYKCGESGHFARECPSAGGGGGGGGGGNCYKCGESGHFSRECPSASGGGGGGGGGSQFSGWGNNNNSDQGTGWKSGTSADGKGSSSTNEQSGWDTKKGWNTSQGMPSSWNQKSADNEKDVKNKDHTDGWNTGKTSEGDSAAGWGQSSGWKSGNGDAGGGRGGGGHGGGGGGGGNCYKCGESGHFSRECPSGGGRGGGGGGGNCYKCGESGHFARECPSAGGGGGGGGSGNCYKCGESGHFARECPSTGVGGGGGGGGNCYKCGESGHFARECPSAGGR